MMQIHSKSDKFPVDHIKLQIEDPDLDIARANNLAKAKARQLNKDAMLLSWYCGKTGEFYPNIYSSIPANIPQELFQDILITDTFKIERIVSKGHASPCSIWITK